MGVFCLAKSSPREIKKPMLLDTVGELAVDDAYISRVSEMAAVVIPIAAPEEGDESIQLPPYVPEVGVWGRVGDHHGDPSQYRIRCREVFEKNPKAWAGVVARFNSQQRQLMVILAMQNNLTDALDKVVPPMPMREWGSMHPARKEAIVWGVELLVRDATRVALELRQAALARAMVIKIGGLDSKDEKVRQDTASELIEWSLGKPGVRITTDSDSTFTDLMGRVAAAAEKAAGIREDVVIEESIPVG